MFSVEPKYSKEKLNKMFQYCEKKELMNEFLNSLLSQYNEKKSLSDRQGDCILSTVSKHKSLNNMFNTIIDAQGLDWMNGEKFISSLFEQYNERGFLTDKQLKALKKICNKYL